MPRYICLSCEVSVGEISFEEAMAERKAGHRLKLERPTFTFCAALGTHQVEVVAHEPSDPDELPGVVAVRAMLIRGGRPLRVRDVTFALPEGRTEALRYDAASAWLEEIQQRRAEGRCSDRL